MTTVEYGYTQPFVETETVEYKPPDTGETVTRFVTRDGINRFSGNIWIRSDL